MRIASGKVVHGQVVFQGDIPEGTHVTLLAREPDEAFEVDEQLEAVLLESIAQGSRGETISGNDLLEEMRRRE